MVECGGVWGQAVGFVIVRVGGICQRENTFTYNLVYKEIYKYCALMRFAKMML
jgi:hypothetical protein